MDRRQRGRIPRISGHGLCAGLLLAGVVALAGCGAGKDAVPEQRDYGVFLGAGSEALERMAEYDTVVLDAQYFTPEEIRGLQASGSKVYSYLNVGSVENFRDYYDKYVSLTIGEYEHWEEERWVDVSAEDWQIFLLEELAPEILDKGVDGFFVDNADVYYYRQTEEIYEGLNTIFQGLQAMDTYVCINGGDTYVMEYLDEGGSLADIADAVNQESVFGRILWDAGKFGRNDPEEREFFQEYVERVAAEGGHVYLLEYTEDTSLMKEIRDYCLAHGFRYFITGDLGLN